MKGLIIDIHTHVFPDHIAQKVLDANRELGFEPFGTGTIRDLRDRISRFGLSACVALAVSTSPRLVEPSNNWLLQESRGDVVPFGTIHPRYPNYKDEIRRIKGMDIAGIKFSSLFQDFYPDDPSMYPIYEILVEEQLPVLFHAGGSMHTLDGEVVQASPKRLRKVLDDFPGMKMIAAHWGGFHSLAGARTYLWGEDLYLDTSYPPGLRSIPQETLIEFIEGHGASRVLFGSDYPFGDQESDIGVIQNLPISADNKDRIFFKNAAELLQI
jgi:predicted TIM-barrel fold metal-dependent hydrolase